MKALLFAMVMLLSGCAYRPAEELVMDPSLSPEQMASVVDAVDDWCASVPDFCVQVSVGEDQGNGYVTHVSQCEGAIVGRTAQSIFTGPIVRFCDDVPDSMLWQIARHEVGHALTGFSDHSGGPGAMTEHLDHESAVSESDVLWATR